MATGRRRILVINPNTTKAMTDALVPMIDSLRLGDTTFEYFTAPSGVPSINDEDDAALSAERCLPTLQPRLRDFDAYLVCCYSQHPLVQILRKELESIDAGAVTRPVTGIFEASIATCLQSIDVGAKFGIVSTGQQWEGIMNDAITDLLGAESSKRFAGTETTGMNASELHTSSADDVTRAMKAATKRLLSGRVVKAICLGCAGMAGMDRTVREACVEELGEDEGRRIRIVDGVVSGALYLDGALRSPF